MGQLMDVGRGGVRLVLGHGLLEDEVVQLLFPRKSTNNRPEGRIIIGRVVQSKIDAGRHMVRIAFGWDADVHEDSRPVRKDPKSSKFFRPFWKRLSSLVTKAWNRR